MMLLLRALARVLGFLLLALLAVTGVTVAVFCIQGGESTLSLPNLAELIGLPELRESVGRLLDDLEAGGPVAQATALAGAGAVLLGLALLVGALVPRRERLLTIDDRDEGGLSARRRPLARVAAALVEQSRESHAAKVKVRPARRGVGGRLKAISYHPASVTDDQAAAAADRQLTSLAQTLSLRVRARGRSPRRGQRRVV